MGHMNDLASVIIRKMDNDAKIKEAKINERVHARETKSRERLQASELRSRERETRLKEKEHTKRTRVESRTALTQAAVSSGANAMNTVAQCAVENVGDVLKNKNINVKVKGICDVKLDKTENDIPVLDGVETPMLEDMEGSESNVFSQRSYN